MRSQKRLYRVQRFTEQVVSILLRTVLVSFFVVFAQALAAAQQCLSPADINTLLVRIEKPPPTSLNKKLEMELLKISATNEEMLSDLLSSAGKKHDELRNKLQNRYEKSADRLCEILKQYGWPTKELVDPEGVSATFEILRTAGTYELQRDLLPIVADAIKKDESQKPEFAGLLDRLRVSAGMKQLFGTQAVITNGFLILYPIEDEAHVDDRRKLYGLSTLEEHKRFLERKYQTPLVRARELPASRLSGNLQASVSNAVKSTPVDTQSINDDVIRVNTNLVNLNVSVFSNQSRTFVAELNRADFKVFEDGKEQEVAFFGSTDKPFDLVLLIDLSSSTSGKRELIKKSTQRFIESARPSDRIAIVTFTSTQTVISPLTVDRSQLLASIQNIEGGGGTSVWDALKFSLDEIVGPPTLERRRAIVLMTDGVDNSMGSFGQSLGSKISFEDLLEAVGESDVLVVPIYLDTERDEFSNDYTKKIYASARKMLQALADETGGSYYKARKLSDLNGVYEQVINDLAKIYSLGYKPSNDKRDATWRNVQVQIVSRPDLVAHAKPGYYAK